MLYLICRWNRRYFENMMNLFITFFLFCYFKFIILTFFFFVMLFYMSLFRLELGSYTATALISIPAFASYLREPWKPLVEWSVRRHMNAIYTSQMHCIVLWVSMWPRRTTCQEGIYISCCTARMGMAFTPHSLHKQMQIRTSNLRVLRSGTLHTVPHGSVFFVWCNELEWSW
jgi:hypothetical protein